MQNAKRKYYRNGWSEWQPVGSADSISTKPFTSRKLFNRLNGRQDCTGKDVSMRLEAANH